MRNATAIKPSKGRPLSAAELRAWRSRRDAWIASLAPASLFHRLFDYIPGVYFFAKDAHGHLMLASRGLVTRYEMRDAEEILGRTDFDLNPRIMAQEYVNDDKHLVEGKVPVVERLELWWNRMGLADWFMVTKLPIRDRRGRVQGVMGILRRPDEAERRLPTFQTVAKAVEMIRRDMGGRVVMAEVAAACGQSLRQLQRQFRAAFGITPQEFLIKTRLLAATRLLEETQMTAAEISEQCGFVDASSFTQHFRARLGATPMAYRRQTRREA
jgi:AraC-like DNA-binding protein